MHHLQDLEHLTDLYRREIGRVSESLSPGDEMFDNEPYYRYCGESAIRCVRLGLLAAELDPARVRRVLDLPSGHGRVLRFLVEQFPTAAFTACDVLPDAVEFCAQTFGAEPIRAPEDPEALLEVLPAGAFDVIWCGSLVTHFDAPRWPGLLRLFEHALADGGLLVLTTHGRQVARAVVRGKHYGLSVEQLEAVAAAYRTDGFGYAEYAATPGYGFSLARPAWVLSRLAEFPSLRVVGYLESGWANHQDVVLCTKGHEDLPEGPDVEQLRHLDFGRLR